MEDYKPQTKFVLVFHPYLKGKKTKDETTAILVRKYFARKDESKYPGAKISGTAKQICDRWYSNFEENHTNLLVMGQVWRNNRILTGGEIHTCLNFLYQVTH